MKTSNEYLKEANALVEKIDVETGIEQYKLREAIFIDVRDSADIASTGTIKVRCEYNLGLLGLLQMNKRHFTLKSYPKIKKLFWCVVQVVWLHSLEKP